MSIEIAGTPPPRLSTTEAKKRSLDVSISPPLDRLANGPRLYRTIRVAGPGPKRQGETTMRFMMIVKADKDSEAGVMPDEKLIDAMTKYNEELFKAGALLDGKYSRLPVATTRWRQVRGWAGQAVGSSCGRVTVPRLASAARAARSR
jgi:hypothetical protein